MPTVTDTKKALDAAPRPQGLQSLIKASMKELARALPKHLNADRLTRIALTCIRLTPKLAECTPESFMGALFTAAQLGMEPVAGRAYLIPFKRNKKKADNTWHSIMECVLVIGYKGLADLFYRHDRAVELSWGVVHKADDFQFQYGTAAFLKHIPAIGDRGPVVAYYVLAKLKGGGQPFMVMSVEECMEHGKKHSKTYDAKAGTFYADSPWAKTPDAMCLKTVLIQLAKLLPLSVELQQAIQADETSRDFRAGIDSALDIPAEPWDEPAALPAPADAAGDAQEPLEGSALGAKA